MEQIRIKTGARSRLYKRLPDLADECSSLLTYLDGNHEISDIAERTGMNRLRVEWLVNEMHQAHLLDVRESSIIIADRQLSKVRARALKNSGAATDASYEQIHRKMKAELTLLTWRDGVDDGGVSMLSARQDCDIEITGLSRLITPLAAILVASGVTRTRISPVERIGREKVEVEDLTGHVLDISDVGSHYFSRVSEKIKSCALFAAPREIPEEQSSFLRIHFGVPSDEQRGMWEQRGENYLVVAPPSSASFSMGPLVVAHRSPCARCAELAKSEREKEFAEELDGYEIPVAQTHYIAGLIADQVLRYIDTGLCESLGAVIVFDFLHPFEIKRRELVLHPLCGCAFM